MDFVSLLPILLYITGLILLIILIILGIKLIEVVDKFNRIADNIEEKVNTFNGALAIFNKAADGIASISDSVVFSVTSAITKIFNKARKSKEEDEL